MFKLADDASKISGSEALDTYFLAWTTTPWTLISNTAVAVNADVEYVAVKVTKDESSEVLVLAEALLSKLDGEIEENAGEIGFYSPHSWWPLPVGFFATASGLGLIIGWWLTLIAVGGLIVSIMGFVLEYEKPSKSTSH